jgi:hypothetical protein
VVHKFVVGTSEWDSLRLVTSVLQLAALILLFGSTPAQADRRVALVVGNSAYTRAPQLTNPVNDAQDIAAKLAELGFSVIVRLNATKPVLSEALIKFARASKGADLALFYFAGHGKQYRGRNYLLPVDARVDDARRGEAAASICHPCLGPPFSGPFARSASRYSLSRNS